MDNTIEIKLTGDVGANSDSTAGVPPQPVGSSQYKPPAPGQTQIPVAKKLPDDVTQYKPGMDPWNRLPRPTEQPKPNVPTAPPKPASQAEGAAGLFDKLKGFLGGARQVANLGQSEGQLLASGRGLTALTQGASQASGALAKLGPYGAAAAAAIVAVTAGAVVFNKALEGLTARARELENYNARIASATQQADVRRLQADIREAQRLGDQYASITDSQSRMENAMRSATDPLKDAFVTAFAGIAETVADLSEELKPSIKAISQLLGGILRGTAKFAELPIKLLTRVLDLINKWFGVADEPEKQADLLEGIRGGLESIRRQMGKGGGAEGPANVDAMNPLKIPFAMA